MMLIGSKLRVVPVTGHIPYTRVPRSLTRENIQGTIELTHGSLKNFFGIAQPRIAVAALNVHAGEGGMFGREEIDVITPAIRQAGAEGLEVVGPVPADSLFPLALRGDFRGLVCMYHDQANIGRKILGRDSPGVSLFLGMPVPVVTVPHGTAYDIAWKGVARHAMLVRAITMAAALAESGSFTGAK